MEEKTGTIEEKTGTITSTTTRTTTIGADTMSGAVREVR